MQALKVATVPMHVKSMDQYVLVDEDTYNKLLDQTMNGRTWTMADLRIWVR
jgi:phage pi2 protein 07